MEYNTVMFIDGFFSIAGLGILVLIPVSVLADFLNGIPGF